MKNINFLTRDTDVKKEMVFKIFGCLVESTIGETINCRILNYNGQSVPMTLINKSKGIIKKGDILDVVGHIREGLEKGYPICEYQVKRFRDSQEHNLDFVLGIEKYNQYVDSLGAKESPF